MTHAAQTPSLPPVPADLWPSAHPAKAFHHPGHMMCLEVPGLTEGLLLKVLSHAIHLEMRAAGEWAGRASFQAETDFPSNAQFARHRADNAARLLALYAAFFNAGRHLNKLDMPPASLKDSASRSYQLGYRDVSPRPHPSPHPLSPQPKASIATQEKPMKPNPCSPQQRLHSLTHHDNRTQDLLHPLSDLGKRPDHP